MPVGNIHQRLRRWAQGEKVTSASRLNEVIDAVQEIRDLLGNQPEATLERPGVFKTIYIQAISGTGTATGKILGEWTSGGSDDVEIYLWPELYPSTGYTYSTNNARNHTSSNTDEELVPPLANGDVLRVEYMYHPGPDVYAWFDCNRSARNWGEVA